MKSNILFLSSILLTANLAYAAAGTPVTPTSIDAVRKSKSGVCHSPGSSHYKRMKNFSTYKTLDECVKSGGRVGKEKKK